MYYSLHLGAWTSADEYGGLQQSLFWRSCARAHQAKEVVRKKDAHIRELEDYIDNLLVRVMEETPSILRTPYEPKRKAGKISKM